METRDGVSEAEIPRPALSWKARIALICFGCAVSLVILEIFLRSVGYVYHFEKQHVPSNFARETFAVLCVGDSCTFGWGAKNRATQSYPAQLEHILQTRHGQDAFGVANVGKPGMNSSQLARRFEYYLQLHKPDLAIVLIGNNDIWNHNETFAYLVGTGESVKFSRKARAWLRSWGDSLRIIRLARMIALNISDKRSERWDGMEGMLPTSGRFRKGRAILGDIENAADLYRYNFGQMRKTAKRRGVKLLWLNYQLGARHGETRYITTVLEEMGADLLELYPYFHKGELEMGKLQWDDSVRQELFMKDKWHPNELGYAVAARAVYNKLVDLGYAEGPPIDVLDDVAVHE